MKMETETAVRSIVSIDAEVTKENLERAQEEMLSINIDKSYMNFLKPMIGSEQITEDDAKFLKRQKESIIQEIRNETKGDSLDNEENYE